MEAIRVATISVVLLLLTYLTLLPQLSEFGNDPGLGWHLASGEMMVERGEVLREDPFLARGVFDGGTRIWVHDQWLSDVIGAVIYRLGGFPLLYAAGSAVYLGAFFLLAGVTGGRGGGSSGLAAVIAFLLAFKLGQVHFVLRPVLMGIFCAACLAALLFGGRDRGSRSVQNFEAPSLRRVSAIWILFFAWANLHGSFALGLAILALVAGVEISLSLAKGGRFSGRWIVTVLGAIGVTFVNPYGLELHRSIMALAGNEYFMSLNIEWRALDLASPEGVMFLGILAVLVLGLARGAPISLSSAAVVLLLAVLSVRTVRILPFFALLSMPAVAISLTTLARVLSSKDVVVLRLTRRVMSALDRGVGTYRMLASSVAVGIVLLVMWTAWKGKMPLYGGPYGPSPTKFPYEIADELLAMKRERVVVLASPNFGGFLEWAGRGKIQPVLDDRNLTVGEELYRAVFSALDLRPGWEARLDALVARYRVDFLLLSIGSEVQRALSKNERFPRITGSERFELRAATGPVSEQAP